MKSIKKNLNNFEIIDIYLYGWIILEIVKVNNDNEKRLLEFIENLTLIKDVDINIVRNASFVLDEDEIIGVLSFEVFSKIGLIRYFIFKRAVEEKVVFDLLDSVVETAKKSGILFLTTIVTKENIAYLFKELGFSEIDSSNVYIDETSLLETKYKGSHVLNYKI